MAEAFDLNSMLSVSAAVAANQVRQIPCQQLVPYHNHKFQLYEGERLEDMVESIRQNGVLIPIIVQPKSDGRYEILVGHNRWNASKIAGLPTIPAIVKDGLTEEEAAMYVVESNLMQRGFDDLKISEQAAVIAMRHSKMFSEHKRRDILQELTALEHPDTDTAGGWDTTRQVGREYGMSRNSVARLIRIDKLIDELKEAVDNGSIAVRTGVELSYLAPVTQQHIANISKEHHIDTKKAIAVRKYADEEGIVQVSDILKVFSGEHTPMKPKVFKLNSDRISRFFEADTADDEIEDTIEKALEYYFLSHKGD